MQVHKQATLTSLLFCWEAEIRYQDGPDECAVEIGIRWEPEGAALKLSADLFGRPWVTQVVQIFLVILLKQIFK
jgi:hypothetical protein